MTKTAQPIAALDTILIRDANTPPRVEGVRLRALSVIRDGRGTLTELLRTDWEDVFSGELPFAQVYMSTTAPGVARDEDRWHVHRFQTDRFYCVSGQIVVAIADPRPGSRTRGNVMLVELAAAPDAPAPVVVTIPPETLHGFVVTSDTPATLLNFPNRLYDPADEGRLSLSEAGITFPNGSPFSYEMIRRAYRG